MRKNLPHENIHTHVLIPRSSGSGLSQNSLALAEQVETVDKRYLLEKKGAIGDAEIMAQIIYALQIQIGAIEEYN